MTTGSDMVKFFVTCGTTVLESGVSCNHQPHFWAESPYSPLVTVTVMQIRLMFSLHNWNCKFHVMHPAAQGRQINVGSTTSLVSETKTLQQLLPSPPAACCNSVLQRSPDLWSLPMVKERLGAPTRSLPTFKTFLFCQVRVKTKHHTPSESSHKRRTIFQHQESWKYLTTH